MIAAKGGPDPDSNFKLRVEIDKARAASMPRENIDRAISKATTEAANLTEITYEGFGPGGIGVIVQAATDNKNRTAQEVKNIFDRAGGNMAGPGAVSFNFENKGYLLLKKSGNAEEQMLQIIDLGVEDVNEVEDGIEVYVAPEKLREVRKSFEEAGFEITETELTMKPKNFHEITDPGLAGKCLKFLETIEEYDDVQKVYSNLDIPDEVAKQIPA
jgi:YebC/PmpR family DNA-binding regulatory protein